MNELSIIEARKLGFKIKAKQDELLEKHKVWGEYEALARAALIILQEKSDGIQNLIHRFGAPKRPHTSGLFSSA